MNKKSIFNWKYCECGCHSYECEIAGRSYSLYWDLSDGWYLNMYSDCKKFKSQEAAEKHIVGELKVSKKELIKQRNSINAVLKAIKEEGNER